MIILWVFFHQIIKCINHAAEISEKKCKYPFVIANTDSGQKGGTHWWSILDIETKTYFFCQFFWAGWSKTFHHTMQ